MLVTERRPVKLNRAEECKVHTEVMLCESTLGFAGSDKDFGLYTKCSGKPLDGDKHGRRDMIRFSFCIGMSGEDKEWTLSKAAGSHLRRAKLVV